MTARQATIAWWMPCRASWRRTWRALRADGFLHAWFWIRLLLVCTAATVFVVGLFQWLAPAMSIPWRTVAVVPLFGPLVLAVAALQTILMPARVMVRPSGIGIAKGQSAKRIRADRIVRTRLGRLPDGRAVLAVRYRDARERRRSAVLVVSPRIDLARLAEILDRLARHEPTSTQHLRWPAPDSRMSASAPTWSAGER